MHPTKSEFNQLSLAYETKIVVCMLVTAYTPLVVCVLGNTLAGYFVGFLVGEQAYVIEHMCALCAIPLVGPPVAGPRHKQHVQRC